MVTTGLTKSGEASEREKQGSARYGIFNNNTELIFHNSKMGPASSYPLTDSSYPLRDSS